MREIKFRGKRKDNGEWVTGSLVNNFWGCSDTKSAVCEIFTPALEDGDCWEDYISDENSVAEVHTESVGQFTGLKENAFEKGNKDVYEGDIIEFIDGKRLVVEWNDDTYKWQYSDGTDINDGERYGSHKMIVGNIYENPELLK